MQLLRMTERGRFRRGTNTRRLRCPYPSPERHMKFNALLLRDCESGKLVCQVIWPCNSHLAYVQVSSAFTFSQIRPHTHVLFFHLRQLHTRVPSNLFLICRPINLNSSWVSRWLFSTMASTNAQATTGTVPTDQSPPGSFRVLFSVG